MAVTPISPQKRVAMVQRYERRRAMLAHQCEMRGDNKLAVWMFAFRGFMGMKPWGTACTKKGKRNG